MSDFVEVSTTELVGCALDWAVACSLNGSPEFFKAFGAGILGKRILHEVIKGRVSPSTNWAQGGPLRDEYRVALFNANGHGVVAVFGHDNEWLDIEASAADAMGPTALIALCRAIVAAKMGDVVRVPKEIIND